MEGSSSASSSTYQHYRSPFGDTTLTKVFVGGLAWETPIEKMREYFEQFGEILEAVIITDKNTGKSKGYGFVTFGDPESAKRAVADANPTIDGRRANCNIAATGRPRQSPPPGRGQGQSGQIYYPGGAQGGSSSVQGPMLTAPPPVPQSIPVMYPPYGYTGYNPAYGYNQAAFYNQQLQQAQYYQQMYGSGASSTPSPNLQQPPHHPYYYTYSMPAAAARAAGYPTMPQHAQRSQGPYFYYSSHSPLNQSSTGSYPVHSQTLSHRQPQQDYQPSVSSDSSCRHQQLPSQIGKSS
ncbi:unnamed protein product [Rhodiola kirilowii]